MAMRGHLAGGWRMWSIGLLLSLGMLALVGRLCFLHLGDLEPVSRPWEMTVLARRGAICDRNNEPMAVSLLYHQPFLDPGSVKPKHDRRVIATLLSERLGIERNRLLDYFAATNVRHQLLPTLVDDRTCRALATNKLISGVGWEDRVVRTYPQGRRLANVIGFVNREQELEGGAGLEQRFNSYLKGISGRIESEKDALQQEIADRRSTNIQPIDGADVHLTIDNNIQYKVECELQRVAMEFRINGAWVIVEKIATGEILAMASYPSFDPNCYEKSSPQDWRNRAIGVNYEPGSTMKSFTIAAGLNERVIIPETRMDVGEGSWFFAGHVLHDHVKGTVDTGTALSKSSNIFCARVGLLLGEKRLRDYQRAFGFGERLGIELPGEERGLVRSSYWGDLATSRIAIGQGVAVTGLQMLNAYCCLANGGCLMKPYLVSHVVSSQGQELLRNRPQVVGRPVRPEVAAAVCRMLIGVTEEGGTATRAKVLNYTVAGKTGTAQIPENGHYSETEYWASFVGILPVEKPVFGVLVVVEKPHPLHMGGYVAAPAFANIADAIARYLEIPATVAPEAEAAADAARGARPPTERIP